MDTTRPEIHFNIRKIQNGYLANYSLSRSNIDEWYVADAEELRKWINDKLDYFIPVSTQI